jgi:hypothetical protein
MSETRKEWLAALDAGIAPFVNVLDAHGIRTYESCQGGEGHSYPEPAVRFYGERGEGFRALAIALSHGFPVRAIRRIWTIDTDGSPHGPNWEIAFWRPAHEGDVDDEWVVSEMEMFQRAYMDRIRAAAGSP